MSLGGDSDLGLFHHSEDRRERQQPVLTIGLVACPGCVGRVADVRQPDGRTVGVHKRADRPRPVCLAPPPRRGIGVDRIALFVPSGAARVPALVKVGVVVRHLGGGAQPVDGVARPVAGGVGVGVVAGVYHRGAQPGPESPRIGLNVLVTPRHQPLHEPVVEPHRVRRHPGLLRCHHDQPERLAYSDARGDEAPVGRHIVGRNVVVHYRHTHVGPGNHLAVTRHPVSDARGGVETVGVLHRRDGYRLRRRPDTGAV